MRAVAPLGLLVIALGGLGLGACGTHVTPDESPGPSAVAEWWLGDWVVDAGALDSAASFHALSPEAQQVTRALIAGSRWRLAFDSRRVHLPDGRLVPFRVESNDNTHAALALGTGERLTLERRSGGLRLTSHDLPLRRAD